MVPASLGSWAAEMQWRGWGLPNWPQLPLGTAALEVPAVSQHGLPGKARRTDSGKGSPPPLSFLAKAETHTTALQAWPPRALQAGGLPGPESPAQTRGQSVEAALPH